MHVIEASFKVEVEVPEGAGMDALDAIAAEGVAALKLATYEVDDGVRVPATKVEYVNWRLIRRQSHGT